MNVIITLNAGLGDGLGDNFVLTANVGTVTPNTATKSELLAGKIVTLSDNYASVVTVTSEGVCTNSVNFNIYGITTTTTTTAAPTTTTTSGPTTTTTAGPTTTTTAGPTTTTTAGPSTTTTTTTTAAPTTTTTTITYVWYSIRDCADSQMYYSEAKVNGSIPVNASPPYARVYGFAPGNPSVTSFLVEGKTFTEPAPPLVSIQYLGETGCFVTSTTTLPPIEITLTPSCDNTIPGSTYRGKLSVAITGGTGVYQLRAGYVPTLSTYVNVGSNPFTITSPTAPYDGSLGLRDTTGGSDQFIVQVIDNGVGNNSKATQISCPTTTTTLAPITASFTPECFGNQQSFILDTFTGGNGSYYASTYTYDTEAGARAGATELVIGGTKTYNNQTSGTRYVYITSGNVDLVKSGGLNCTTTTTHPPTTTTTAAPTTTTLPPITYNISYTCSNGLAIVTIDTFAGGSGGYSYGNTLFNYATDALTNTNWIVGTSKTYSAQSFAVSGDLWAIVKDSVGNLMPKKVTPASAANWVSTGNNTCVSCVNTLVYTDNNQCSSTYGWYRIGTNGTPQSSQPTYGNCSTSANWLNNGSFSCYGTCNKYNIEQDYNPCSSTYGQTKQGSLVASNSTFCGGCCGQSTSQVQGSQIGTYYTCSNGSVISTPVYQNSNTCYTGSAIYLVGGTWQTTNPSNSYPNTSANWVNNGSAFCSNCVAYQPQIDTNTCSSTYNQTRNLNLGQTSPCVYTASYTNAIGTLYVCNVSGGGVNSYTVYQNTNSCFTGNQYYATNGSTYASNPSNSYPDTTQNWQPNGANYCSGVDLYQPQIQTNPCAVNYNGTRDYLIQANSNTCAEVYVLSDCLTSNTGYSIVYVKNTFAVGDRVTSSGATFVITSVTTTGSAGSYALTSTGLTGCPDYTQFYDQCTGAYYYILGTGYSGIGTSSDVPGDCLQVTGTTTSPSGTQIYNWTYDSGCECL